MELPTNLRFMCVQRSGISLMQTIICHLHFEVLPSVFINETTGLRLVVVNFYQQRNQKIGQPRNTERDITCCKQCLTSEESLRFFGSAYNHLPSKENSAHHIYLTYTRELQTLIGVLRKNIKQGFNHGFSMRGTSFGGKGMTLMRHSRISQQPTNPKPDTTKNIGRPACYFTGKLER